jgi:hypothetical protein
VIDVHLDETDPDVGLYFYKFDVKTLYEYLTLSIKVAQDGEYVDIQGSPFVLSME